MAYKKAFIMAENKKVLKEKSAGKNFLTIDEHEIINSFSFLEPEIKIEILRRLYEIRYFEAETEQFIIKGQIPGTCHLYVGQEATAIGAIYAIDKKDYITSTHRVMDIALQKVQTLVL